MGFFFVFVFVFVLSFSFKCFRYMFTCLRNHLNFQNAFVLDKYHHDFLFLYSLWRSKKISLKTYEIMYGFGRKENTEGFFML